MTDDVVIENPPHQAVHLPRQGVPTRPGEPRILIVMPAWNEAKSIYGVIREIQGELPHADVLVVDDGSVDDTAGQARAAGAIVARLPYNLGVGGAMRLGYRFAEAHDYDFVVQVDADGQHDPRYVPKLIDALATADVVIGARFAGEGRYRVRGPRKWAMVLLSKVVSRIARTKLTDTTSGFRATNRKGTSLFASWYPVEYLGDTVETLVYAARRDVKIAQVPVAMRTRVAGTPSHSPIKATIYLIRAAAILALSVVRR
jgi:glycosyltransferase involved in cell wall biosynthesis